MSVRRVAAASVGALAIAASSVAGAQEFIKPGTETFTFQAGGIITEDSTSVRIDGPVRGTELHLGDLLGLDSSSGSYYLAGAFRFASRNRLAVQYINYKRSGSRQIDQAIEIGGEVIPIDTNLSAEVRQQLFVVNYGYSFVKTDQVEVAVLLGLYGAKYDFKFDANKPVVAISESTTVPLPMIGAVIDWYVTPRWTVTLSGEGMKARVGDVDGTAWNAGLSTDYMLWRNVGIGIAANAIGANVDITKSGFTGALDTRTEFVRAYVQLKF
jgi:hypothetical protein